MRAKYMSLSEEKINKTKLKVKETQREIPEVKWYKLLVKPTESNSPYLFGSETITSENIIVCQELEYHKFAKFSSILDLSRFVSGCKYSHNCLYEVIRSKQPHKWYADVDIVLEGFEDENSKCVLPEEETPLLIAELKTILVELLSIHVDDILIASSNGYKKHSYHVVVDKWCLANGEEAKAIYQEVRDRMSPKYQGALDLLYKSTQQFRLYGSHKFGQDRVKEFREDLSSWKPPIKPKNDEHLELLRFTSFLVGNIAGCKYLPSFVKEKTKSFNNDETELSQVQSEEVMAVFQANYKEHTAFKFTGVSGNFISLKRLRASHCDICERNHQNENPYLLVANGCIYFDCRRADLDKPKKYIGRIDMAEETKEEAKLEEVIKPKSKPANSGLTVPKKIKKKEVSSDSEEKKPKKIKKKEISSDSEEKKPKKLAKSLKEQVKKIKETEVEEEEKESDSTQYDPYEEYYVNNYVREIQNKVFKGKTLNEAMKKYFKFTNPRVRRVCRLITSGGVESWLKLSDIDLFHQRCEINFKGGYGSFGHGDSFIEFPLVGKATKKMEIVTYDETDADGVMTKKEYVRQPVGPFLSVIKNLTILSEKIVCDPYHRDEPNYNDRYFNIFCGFKAVYQPDMSIEEAEEICLPLLKHIKDFWANGEEKMYNRLMEWLCYVIRTLMRTNIMLTIIGAQGTGKSIVGDFIRKYVYGEAITVQVTGLGRITGKFNKTLAGKMYVQIDETNSKNGEKGKHKADAEELKNCISAPDIQVEPKGKDPYTIINYNNFNLTSNHDDCLCIEEDDRRNFVNKIIRKKENKVYYDKLAKCIFTEKVGNAFYTLARKHPAWSDITEIPDTPARDNCIKETRARGSLFIDEVFVDGVCPIPYHIIKKEEDGSFYISLAALFTNVYTPWHERTNNGILWSSSNLAKVIKKEIKLETERLTIGKSPRDYYYKIPKKFYKTIMVYNCGKTIVLNSYVKEEK